MGRIRHIYTFQNICKEDHKILLKDETTKIFLNAHGHMDDVSKELKAFLDYVAGKSTEDAFVKKLELAVKEAKRNREWRYEYMTLLMRDQENIEQGIKQGIEALVSTLKDLGVEDDLIVKKIQEKFNISKEEAEKYVNSNG